MKHKLLKSIALGVMIAFAIACQPKKEPTADATPAVDKEKIKGAPTSIAPMFDETAAKFAKADRLESPLWEMSGCSLIAV